MLLRDARKAVERLEESGVPTEHADAIVDLLLDADERVATQQDIEELETRLESQMEVQEERLTRRIQDVETRLSRFMLAGFTAIAALVTIFQFL